MSRISGCTQNTLHFAFLGAEFCYTHLSIVGLHPGIAAKLPEILLKSLQNLFISFLDMGPGQPFFGPKANLTS